MKQKLRVFLTLLLCAVASVGWADEVSIKYIFNTKDWEAKIDGTIPQVSANWTSGIAGYSYQSDKGVQVTTGVSGANATSPKSYTNISKITVEYCTNASNGVGTISVKVGEGTAKSFSVTKPSSGGTTLKNAEFTYDPTETGKVNIAVTCTTNSIYIHAITITYDEGAASVSAPTFNPVDGTTFGDDGLEVTISQADNKTIYYTLDGSDPDNTSELYTAPFTINATTTVKAIAYDGTDASTIATATYTYVDPNAPGTQNNPYTVAQARAAIDAGSGTQGVYATGIVSAIPTAWSSDHENITFNFVDNSGDEVFLQAYRCASGVGADASQVAIGDIVVVHGNLTKYGSTYEFGQGCTLVSLTHPIVTTPTITVSPTSLADFTYEEEDGPSAAKTISVSGANLTEAIALALDEDSNFEMSLTEGSDDYANNLTLSPEDGSVASTKVYVRLKAGLETGEYTGTITLSSTGAANVTVNLSGSVTAPEAQNVTWDLTKASYDAEPTEYLVTWSSDYATMTLEKGTSSTNANNYLGGTNTNSHTRLYQNQKLSISPVTGYRVSSVVITATSSSYAKGFTGNSWTNATASTSGTTISVTPTNGKNAVSIIISEACRATAVKVFYEPDNTPAISVDPPSIDAAYEETRGTLTVTYDNINDNSTASIFFCNANGEAATYDWIEANFDNDKNISYHINANTNPDAARTAYLKVKVGDVNSNLVTITQAKFVRDYAILPFSYDDNGSGTLPVGLTQSGIGTYSSSPAMKFDAEGDNLVLKMNEAPKALYFDIQGKGNGTWAGTFTVQTSSDGESYTDLKVYTSLTGDVETEMFTDIASNIRYIKWIFTSKETGFNVALGNIIAANETISVTIGSSATGADGAYYSSVYYSDKALKVPADVECLTYKVVDGALTVSKTYSAGDVIPADEAVVIKASASGTVTFPVTTETAEKDANSQLKGVDGAKVINEAGYKYYKLTLNAAKEEGTAGFYFDKNVTDGSTINAAANKCYLRVPVDQTNGAKGFVFGEETDGINAIDNSQQQIVEGIYNLAGQCVNKTQKGIYIVNGKKVVIK